MKTNCLNFLLAEWKGNQRIQNGKESKLNYSRRNETNKKISETRNGRKKEVITYYSDTSPTTAPKSGEHQYCSKNVATLGATNFTLSTQGSYKLGGDIVVYTSKSDGSALYHCSVGDRPLGFFKTDFYGFRRSLITHERKRNLL